MERKYIIAFIISIFALTIISCEKEEPVGPSLEDLYGSFRIFDTLSIDVDQVDFSTTENLKFNGSWSTIADWTITITGKTSGSTKTITGKTKTLDTTLAMWNGTSDGLFFQKEACEVVLTFKNQPNTYSSEIEITGLHDYSQDGIVLADFETTATQFYGGSNTLEAERTDTFSITPEGSYCYYVLGKEPGNAWWLGGFSALTASALVGEPYFPLNAADTATTYINFFAYGYGHEQTYLDFTFKEDDNEDGTVDEQTEDAWSYKAPITKTGWNKISFPISAVLNSNSNVGNAKLEIDKIGVLYISLMSDGAAQAEIGCAVDFIIITKGKPL